MANNSFNISYTDGSIQKLSPVKAPVAVTNCASECRHLLLRRLTFLDSGLEELIATIIGIFALGSCMVMHAFLVDNLFLEQGHSRDVVVGGVLTPS